MGKLVKLVVTIPAFNEENSIGDVIKNIPRDCCDDVKIVVIDDGSNDNTSLVAQKAGADFVIKHSNNLGLAKTYRDLIDVGLDLDADILLNIDADGQYEPKEISKLIHPILNNEADIVLGSRFAGKIEQMPISKKIGNKIATKVTSRVAGQNFSDCQTGFRALNKEAALRMNTVSDFTYTQESLVEAVYNNLKICEVPVNFYKREGESRLFPNVFNYAKRAGTTLIKTYIYHKPLKFFLYVGMIVLLIGFVLGMRVLIHYLTTTVVTPYLPTAVLSTLCCIVGFQIIIFGLLGDMLRRNQNLHEEILYRLKKNESNNRQSIHKKNKLK